MLQNAPLLLQQGCFLQSISLRLTWIWTLSQNYCAKIIDLLFI